MVQAAMTKEVAVTGMHMPHATHGMVLLQWSTLYHGGKLSQLLPYWNFAEPLRSADNRSAGIRSLQTPSVGLGSPMAAGWLQVQQISNAKRIDGLHIVLMVLLTIPVCGCIVGAAFFISNPDKAEQGLHRAVDFAASSVPRRNAENSIHGNRDREDAATCC